jgi:RNA polymerase sigma-70 factor (ECF subfamily)
MEPLEREWINRARQGDLSAFGELVARHDGYITRVIRNMVPPAEVEDIYQETFVKAFTGLAAFRAESGFRTWLTRIAINQCLNLRRRHSWKGRFSLPAELETDRLLHEISSSDSPPDQQAVQREMLGHLQVAMNELPDSQRVVFIFKYVQGCSIKEIAAILGKAEGTVKSDLFRAMQKVRRHMHQFYA